MSIASLSGLPNQQSPGYFSTRRADLAHLGSAIRSGDLAGARQAYQAIIKLGQSGPFQDKEPFAWARREHDFSAIGQALQSGDLAGARQAFEALRQTFSKPKLDPPPPVAAPSGPVQSSNVSFVA
jgi:hypothetical protein